ncbi:hypothetical protein CONPUDRAFT_102921 [Coniophora puteana RWD-64-598 SS2]|uniref:Uncharacterized protein n=1 Tax=Coniophora puteana (strain RWD-64-598) TaxID=741705 RepID=A0A5M3MSP7_CONPW|nr:uncharacterized protein CONPUDRAFT_102921 [Coniophora puteana RWD-64-598 SS2]EIW82120.1 hypothetical protein CONPUDRAFT_102921 [Coniophora puteana RWD-64-598 SS2]
MSERKLSLPAFLKVLTSHDVPVSTAMAVAGKIYKQFNTAESLSTLTEPQLVSCGIDDKDLRRQILMAVTKAGFIVKRTGREPATSISTGQTEAADTVQAAITPRKRTRKRDDGLNRYLPERPDDEAASYGSLEFNEELDEQTLASKATVINRAPLMTAWAMVVAERLGFQREEALSIASAYTEMNAISKGVSIGVFKTSKKEEMERYEGGAQPYIDLMGRRPLYQTRSEQWRALINASPALPSEAFSYISRSFRQTTSHMVGALRLLAESYPPKILNERGFALYADFRPTAEGWGARGEVKCEKILSLRRKLERVPAKTSIASVQDVVKIGDVESLARGADHNTDPKEGDRETCEPEQKKQRTLTVEEYEAMLDEDLTFNNADLP